MNSTLFFPNGELIVSSGAIFTNTVSANSSGVNDSDLGEVEENFRSRWFYILFPAVCFLLAIFILAFNAAVFSAACWRTRSLRTLSSLHVISLAASDMLQGVGMMLQVGVYTGNGRRNRYPRIVTAGRSMAVITCAWCAALAFGGSVIFNNNFRQEIGCHSETTISRHYAWTRFAVFVTTALISGFCHSSIQLTAIKHIRQIHSTHQAVKQKAALSGTTASSLRLVKTFFLVYILLLVCWLPGLIAFAVGLHAGPLMNVLAILAELNAVLNILVYILSNIQFRRAIANLLRCRLYKELVGDTLSRSHR